MSRSRACAGLVLSLAFAPTLGFAQSGTSQAPSPWSVHAAVGAPEPLTLSATYRLRVDAIEGQPRPGFNARDVVFNLRGTLFAEYQAGPVRLGAEVYDSRVYGADRGSPITTNEVNTFEFVQAYAALDAPTPFGPGSAATVQAGRFVMNIGSRRLIAADDYRNTTNGYTGLRADLTLAGDVAATAYAVLPTARRPDDLTSLLDNQTEVDREGFEATLWGGLVQRRKVWGRDLLEASFVRFDEGDITGRPNRDRALKTVGLRALREPRVGAVDYEVEAYHQWGSISQSAAPGAPRLPVSAAFAHAAVGYTFDHDWRPRLSFRFDRATGDGPGGKFGRFDTLFGMRRSEIAPSGLYNSVGRANFISPGLRLEVAPSPRTDAFLAYRPLWLDEPTDSFSTSNVRDPTGRSGRFAGHQSEARLRHWLVPDALRFEFNVLHLNRGRFLRTAPNAPGNGDTLYSSLNLTAFF